MTDALVTAQALRRLEEEIHHLKTEKRPEVVDRIAQAREFGDAAENSDYLDARNEQEMLEQRIEALEQRLASVSVVDGNGVSPGVVAIGRRVQLRDLDVEETGEYLVVGAYEADSIARKVSHRSPVGEAILGRKKGEIVDVLAPRGKLRFEIVDVRPA